MALMTNKMHVAITQCSALPYLFAQRYKLMIKLPREKGRDPDENPPAE